MFLSLFNTELREDTRNLAVRINRNSKKSKVLFIVGFRGSLFVCLFVLFVSVRNNRTATVQEGSSSMVIFMINYKNHRVYNTLN